MTPGMHPPALRSLRVYVPAKNIEISKQFYSALGFRLTAAWGGAFDCELSGREFRLQDYYVKAWADNCMIVLGVENIAAWYEHVRSVISADRFPGARFTAPETAGESLVLHVWDPSGVLLVFVQ